MQRIVTLAARPDLRDAVVEMIEKNFPSGSPVKEPAPLEREFALLLDPRNADRHLVVLDGERPVSSACYRVFDVRVPGAVKALRCAGVGLVVTAQSERAKGFASQLQKEIEARALAEQCALSVLWSDLVGFYTSRGYIVGGAELQWQASTEELTVLKHRLQAEVSTTTPWRLGPLASFAQTTELYRHASLGPARDAKVYDELLRLPDTHVVGAFDGDRLVGYAFLGKARDLRDTIHEICGQPKAVGALLKALAQHSDTMLRVHQPLHSPLRDEIEYWMGPAEKSPLAFFKVLDASRFGEWINGASVLPVNVRIEVSPEGRVLLRSNREIFFESDDPGHLVQLFLGPWTPAEMMDIPPLLTERLAGTRIPSVYFWGFDSV